MFRNFRRKCRLVEKQGLKSFAYVIHSNFNTAVIGRSYTDTYSIDIVASYSICTLDAKKTQERIFYLK